MLRLLVMVLFVAALYQAARRPTNIEDESTRRVRMTAFAASALLALCWV